MSERVRDGGQSFLGRLLWPRRSVGDAIADGATAGEPAYSSVDDAVARNPVEGRPSSSAVSGGTTGAPVAPDGVGLRDITAALTALEKSVGRAGREQFKALALAQTQQEQMGAALEALRVAGARREAELEAWPARMQVARDTARLEVAGALFPTLDGLDEAIRAGGRLLDRPAPTPTLPPPQSLLDRLFPARREAAAALPEEAARNEVTALREAMEAWLTGLTFVRGRLLDVLATEGVRPIDARGQPFDPHLHVAIDVIPPGERHEGLAPGTVAAELRRGYRAGDRVLRYAEVAVVGEAPISD